MVFGHAMFQAHFMLTFAAEVWVKLCEFGVAVGAAACRLNMEVFLEIALAVQSLVDAKILFHC